MSNAQVLRVVDKNPSRSNSVARVTEEQLIQRTLDGDDQAYALIVNRYRNRIFNFIFRYCSDRGEAEDLTQEVFLKAYRNLSGFRGDSKFSTWLFQIAKNMSINKLRSLSRRIRQYVPKTNEDGERGDPVDFLPSGDRDPEEVAVGREEQKMVQRAILKLPSSFRLVLILRDIEDMTYDEIGEILELPQGTVKSRIHRARSELKAILEEFMASGVQVR